VDILHWGLAVLPGLILRGYRTSSGSLAILAAIRRAFLKNLVERHCQWIAGSCF
jgi:hypothetical protein